MVESLKFIQIILAILGGAIVWVVIGILQHGLIIARLTDSGATLNFELDEVSDLLMCCMRSEKSPELIFKGRCMTLVVYFESLLEVLWCKSAFFEEPIHWLCLARLECSKGAFIQPNLCTWLSGLASRDRSPAWSL